MKSKVVLLFISLLALTGMAVSCEQPETELLVTSVSISQPSAEMVVGEVINLKALVTPSNALDGLVITWDSSKQSVATVTQKGMVTAIAEGTTTISATAAGKTGSCVVTVVKGFVAVESIELDYTELSMVEGEEITITATVKPDDATDKTVTWDSSDKTIATIDKVGKVTAIKKGSAIITAKTEDGGKTATCSITVEQNLAPSITIGYEKVSAISVVLQGKANLSNTASSDLWVGFQYSKYAGILPTNSTMIDANDSDANYNYSSTVMWLEPGTTYYFRSVVRQGGKDEYGETLEFTTKDLESLIETLDPSDITATSAKMNAKLDLTFISYESIEYGFYVAQSEKEQGSSHKCSTLTDKAYFCDLIGLRHNKQYWFKSYVRFGDHAYYGTLKSFTTDVVHVESVTLYPGDWTFKNIGESIIIAPTVLPSDADDKYVTWSSNNNSVATVNSDGVVYSRGNGQAIITATTRDQGKTNQCIITVSQIIKTISLDKENLTLESGGNYTLIATITPANAANTTLKWSSSDESIAIVSDSGNISAVSGGVATIKAETTDGSQQYAICRVCVYEPIEGTAIDLGLSVYWSDMNLGANSPEEAGAYFAWGETLPKDDYDWDTYIWSNGTKTSLTKYNSDESYGVVDNKIQLDITDDAAHYALGDSWRIPSSDEWNELQQKCTWTSSTQNGVSGNIVTGPNGNSIFLPATGYMEHTGLHTETGGYFWTSSLADNRPDCAVGGKLNKAWDRDYRMRGRTIRPVCDK